MLVGVNRCIHIEDDAGLVAHLCAGSERHPRLDREDDGALPFGRVLVGRQETCLRVLGLSARHGIERVEAPGQESGRGV